MYGHVSVIKVLRKFGEKLGEKDKGGNTPAHYAAELAYNDPRHTAVIEALHEAGVKLDEENNKGDTPAELARIRGNEALARKIKSLLGQSTYEQALSVLENEPVGVQ